jgi:hypothetical protein
MEVLDHTPVPIAAVYSAAVQDYPRAPGWHVTGLMDVIEEALGRKVDYSGLSPDVPEMGKLWEWAVRQYLIAWARELGWQFSTADPPPSRDGITATLDGMFEGGGESHGVVEVKLKFSPRDLDPSSNRRWMTQVKSYCAVMGVTDVYMLVGRLGTRPPFAAADRHVIRFGQDEIDSTWDQLLGAVRYAAERDIRPNEEST